jgi:hypothetical protein
MPVARINQQLARGTGAHEPEMQIEIAAGRARVFGMMVGVRARVIAGPVAQDLAAEIARQAPPRQAFGECPIARRTQHRIEPDLARDFRRARPPVEMRRTHAHGLGQALLMVARLVGDRFGRNGANQRL